MRAICTLIGATIGAYIASSGFFLDFTNRTNWQMGDRFSFITKYDAGFSAASGAIGGGIVGLLVGVMIDRYASKQRMNFIINYLLKLRENERLEQVNKEAIDLTLASINAHENREPSARTNDAPRT